MNRQGGGPEFIYSGLDTGSICLSRIHGSVDAMESLTYDLGSEKIDRLPSHEALSYCWGDSKDKVYIKCSGLGELAITRT